MAICVSMTNPIRLLIADDHALMREGLKQLFAVTENIIVTGEAVDGPAILERLPRGDIDLLLLDMTMPGICGDDLIAHVRADYPDLPILILSMHNEPQIAQRALKAGANGYITKDSDPHTLLAAIHKVASGGRFIDSDLAEQLAFAITAPAALPEHLRLTTRELQILRLLARGVGVNEIAAQLAISNKTVSTHKARFMEKMGFSSTADVIKYAMLNGLSD